MEPLEPTEAERKVIEAAAKGEYCDFAAEHPGDTDPPNGAAWGDDRTVGSKIIRALALCQRPNDWPVHAKGVRVVGAKITGPLDFEAATVLVPLGLLRCYIEKPIILRDASTRTISLAGSQVPGITADRVSVDGAVFLRDGFHARGEVRFLGARIRASLDCRTGTIANDDGTALNCDGARVDGSVVLNKGFRAEGEVRFVGAKIGGNLDCEKGTFDKEGDRALSCDGAEIGGDVSLNDGFCARGEVGLAGVKIGGDLNCTKGTFENERRDALSCDHVEVGGNVFLSKGFQAKGEVRFPSASILGQFVCEGGAFANTAACALRLESARVHRGLFFRRLKQKPEGTVDLTQAWVDALIDDEASWPAKGNLSLDGFAYDRIGGDKPLTDSETRLRWLHLQPAEHLKTGFRPQPFEQLVAVLRKMGHEHDARKIAIEKQRLLRRSGRLGPWDRIINWLLGVIVGHGYRPWRAVSWALAVVLFGWGVFDVAEGRQLIVPAKERVYMSPAYIERAELPPEYPQFRAFVYSLDVFLPIVELHQEEYWLPLANGLKGWAVWIYMWLHIAFGWVLTSLAVLGLGGVIKKD
ncbi:MAG: hypothetical protein WD014_00135 [Dongiaceae bacterium]